MKKFIEWLVTSSANPENVSMTIQGILLANIGAIMFFVSHFGWHIDQSAVGQIIESGTGILGTFLTAFGLIRKIVLTIKAGVQ